MKYAADESVVFPESNAKLDYTSGCSVHVHKVNTYGKSLSPTTQILLPVWHSDSVGYIAGWHRYVYKLDDESSYTHKKRYKVAQYITCKSRERKVVSGSLNIYLICSKGSLMNIKERPEFM